MPEDSYNHAWNSGRAELVNLFKTMVEELNLFGTSSQIGKDHKVIATNSSRIFLIHGHDEAMKQAVARILEKIGLEPIILHEQPNQGRTIIEKFTDYSDVSFAIALLSPDDLAYSKDQSPKEAMPRARQNVIFELGYFIGALDQNRVLALYQEVQGFEMPSDYSGVLYVPYDKAGRWQIDLIRELKACGYPVDANKLLEK